MLFLQPGTHSLPFVPSKACPCMDLSSAALALRAPPKALAALALDDWRNTPSHTSLLLQHWVWFSLCGPQRAPGSGWPSLCQHPAAFATHLPGTRYVPGPGLGSRDTGVGQTGVLQPFQGLQPDGEDRTTWRAEACGGHGEDL